MINCRFLHQSFKICLISEAEKLILCENSLTVNSLKLKFLEKFSSQNCEQFSRRFSYIWLLFFSTISVGRSQFQFLRKRDSITIFLNQIRIRFLSLIQLRTSNLEVDTCHQKEEIAVVNLHRISLISRDWSLVFERRSRIEMSKTNLHSERAFLRNSFQKSSIALDTKSVTLRDSSFS